MMINILLLVLLVMITAIFSGSDVAYMSLDISHFEDDTTKNKKIRGLKENPNRLLGTTQIGVAVMSVLTGIFASSAFLSHLDHWVLSQFQITSPVAYASALAFLMCMILVLVLICGVLVPRRVAMAYPHQFASKTNGILMFLMWLGTPIYMLVSSISNGVLRLMRIDPNQVSRVVSEADIRTLVQSSTVDVQEKMMIDNVFEFDNLEVQEIMVHRTDVIALDSEASLESIAQTMNEARYTRFPVYEENIDNVIGIIHLRDIYRFISGNSDEVFNIRDLIRDPYFVPDTKATNEVFADMKRLKIHMAVVIDEYGGTAGIVTMEDLIEEVMGNIMDEYDDEEEAVNDIVERPDGSYLVEGSCDLEDLQARLGIELPVDDFDTVSGFMIDVIGKIPTAEDMADDAHRFIIDGYEFSIDAVEERVIARALIQKMPEA